MSSPAEFYNSLPPISKAYGTACLLTTVACQLGLFSPEFMVLHYPWVFSQFQSVVDLIKAHFGKKVPLRCPPPVIPDFPVPSHQEPRFSCFVESEAAGVWRLFTNFFFLGNFSINFGIRLLMIARYGVQLERGPFDRRTADFLWMMIVGALFLLVLGIITMQQSVLLSISLVFMLLYIWSREFPNAQINIYGLVNLKAFYLPWAMLALDVIFGSPLFPDLMGIIAGHLYYFLTVLHPLAGGRNLLKTPFWLHKLVARWRLGTQANSPVRPNSTGTGAFRGRGYRLNG